MQTLTAQEAAELLGITLPASDAAIRDAYTEQIRRFPPDRDPDRFERIRDAYNLLRDAESRARSVLEGPQPSAPLESLVDEVQWPRQFVGGKPWLDVLKDKRS